MLFVRNFILIAGLFTIACNPVSNQQVGSAGDTDFEIINEEAEILVDRINPPKGYSRIKAEENSFTAYLRSLPLKPHGSNVMLYNNKPKFRNVHEAVVDLPIGNKDLHQCADALIRLRAEYLYSQKRYSDIHFNLTNGFRTDYLKWKEGYRVKVDGNKTWYVKTGSPSSGYDNFWDYLEFVFIYAGSYSLEQETYPVDFPDMQPGDILIQGGFPGHAVIVADMAEDENGKRVFMLAQSYMPAQEIHILKNTMEQSISPWYRMENSEILTPEWTFKRTDLRRFH